MNKARRALLSIFLFALGLVTIDRGILFLGDKLVRSPYWREPLLSTLATTDPQWVAFGGCRVALHLDPKIFSHVMGQQFFNAGRVVEGLGNMDFALRLALDRPSVRYVVFQVDDGIWDQTESEVRQEIENRRMWFDLLMPETRAELLKDYGLSEYFIQSGFWKYRGVSENFIKTIGKWVAHKDVQNLDGYRPRKSDQNIIRDLGDAKITQNIRKTFYVNPYAEHKVRSLIERALRHHVTPVLLLSPMHRLRATDEVNRQQIAQVQKIATEYKVPYLNYLSNSNSYAGRDEIWSDQGHFNVLGAELFSNELAKDLKTFVDQKSLSKN
jgi:hypothetical protein